MTETPEGMPGKPPYRALTATEFERLPNAEFCDVVESILSDPERNERLIRMMADDPDGDLKDIVKKFMRDVEAMLWAFRSPD